MRPSAGVVAALTAAGDAARAAEAAAAGVGEAAGAGAAAGWGAVVGVAAAADAGGVAGAGTAAGVAAVSATCTLAINAPADTLSPVLTSTDSTTPLTGDGTSIEAFSLSSVISGSSMRISLPFLIRTSTTLK